MRNELLTGGVIALTICFGGLMLSANPNMKPAPEKKTAPETKSVPETKKTDAKKAFGEAFEKRNKTKGYHFTGKRETSYVEMGMTIPAQFNGIKNNKDNLLYMTYQTSVMGSSKKYELYQKADKKFARDIASEERVEGKTHSPIMQGDRLMDTLEGYKFAKEEKLDERDHTVIEATIKLDGANKLLSELPMPLPAEAKLTCDKSGFRIWIDKKTSLISKMYFFVEVSAAMPGAETPEEGEEAAPKSGRKIAVDINLFDYDKDIEISVPDEVKEVLDASEESEEKEKE